LTFDDGPTPHHTPAILDALAALDVRAAFFVVGQNARRYPDLLRRIDAEGHIIGNHSFHHHHLGVMRGVRYWRDQLARTDEVIARETGKHPLYFRPPMGFKNPLLARTLRQGCHHLITWTRRGLDGLPTTEARIARRLGGKTRPGDIVALHDGIEPYGFRRDDATVRAIPTLIRAYRDRGISPVRLDQLIRLAPYFGLSSNLIASEAATQAPVSR